MELFTDASRLSTCVRYLVRDLYPLDVVVREVRMAF